MRYRGTYYPASGCTGRKPGVEQFVAWYLDAYQDRNAVSLGTYVCKRLGSGWSVHAEGRAADLGTSPYGIPSGWGWELANKLVAHSAELGIQLVIFQNRIWSATQPDNWRNYTGDYHGHIHVEFTPEAANELTEADVRSVFGGTAMSIVGLQKGDEGAAVEHLQSLLWRAGFPPVKGDSAASVDGVYGDLTAKAVLACRQSQGSSAKTGDLVSGWGATQILCALIDNRAGKGAGKVNIEVPDVITIKAKVTESG